MKHFLTTLCVALLSITATVAQEKPADKPAMSKEEKAAAKAKKEADLQNTFDTAGLTADEQQLVRTSNADRIAYGKTLKADTTLSEEDLKAKGKEFSIAEDAKLKEKLGAQKYKALKDAQKAQREAAKAAGK